MDRVHDARVMVVGSGALGNEALKNLALFGVGHIYVVDFDTDEIQRTVSSYISTYEVTLIEDYFTSKANDFIKEAKASDFETAGAKLGVKTAEISRFPLNYGNVNVLNSIDTTVEGMSNAETNENLLSKAFAVKLN